MLAEWWSYLTTPCSPEARRMGYLRESIAIRARHRRCRHAWAPHLAKTRQGLVSYRVLPVIACGYYTFSDWRQLAMTGFDWSTVPNLCQFYHVEGIAFASVA
jgi:hypothetical protein